MKKERIRLETEIPGYLTGYGNSCFHCEIAGKAGTPYIEKTCSEGGMEVKKERIRLETLEIPDIPEDDIVEVITNVKELLQKRAVKKYESSILKSLRELLYVHGWKSIVLQGGLTLLVALAVWLCLPNGYKMNSVAFLSLGSSLLSVAVTVEVFRCDIYGMKELEMASPYSPQRMLMWKMLLLGGISFLGILIIAVSISLQTDIHLLTLLYSGFIPFLLLNAFTLHLYAHDQVLQVFLTVYGFAAGGLVLLELFGVGYWIGFLEQYGGQLFLAVLVYSGYVLWDHCRRNLHV